MRDIFVSIRRTPYQSLAAFLVLFFTVFLATAIFIILSFLYGLLGYVETRPQVTVYFKTDVKEDEIFKTREELMSSDKVASIKYVDKQNAFKAYQKYTKDNPLLQEMVSADILPASLEIYAKRPEYLPQIAEFLGKQPVVDEVQFQKDIVQRLLSLTTILRKTAIALFIFLIVMSVIVLVTTTLFKIALKKDEIELLRLLGASRFYIRKPFLAEGLLFGLTSSFSSYLFLIGIIFYLNPFLLNYLRGVPNLLINLVGYTISVWPAGNIFLLISFGFSVLFGGLISLLASFLATQKFLK